MKTSLFQNCDISKNVTTSSNIIEKCLDCKIIIYFLSVIKSKLFDAAEQINEPARLVKLTVLSIFGFGNTSGIAFFESPGNTGCLTAAVVTNCKYSGLLIYSTEQILTVLTGIRACVSPSSVWVRIPMASSPRLLNL